MNYLSNLKEIVEYFTENTILTEKVSHLESIDRQLANGEIPKKNFGQIELSDDEIVSILSNSVRSGNEKYQQAIDNLQEFDNSLRDYRSYLQNSYGYWSAVTIEFLDKFIELQQHDSYLELMSGVGYISAYLNQTGKKVRAIDNKSWIEIDELNENQELFPSMNMDVIEAVQKYGNDVSAIILSWAPQDSEIDYEILQAYRKLTNRPTFSVIGEQDGVTNSLKFWDNIKIIEDKTMDELNKYYNKFDMIDEKIFVVD